MIFPRSVRCLPGSLALAALALAVISCGTTTTTAPSSPTPTPTPAPVATTLTGLVTDVKSGAPVASVSVAVQGKTATTGADGRYSISGLTDGTVSLTAQHQGHINFSQSVTLSGATTANVGITPSATVGYGGSWSGSWKDTTFGTTGTMTMTLASDTIAQTLQMVLDVNGAVFGSGDPPAETYNGTYTAASGATFTKTSAAFGNITIAISPTGQIIGSATGIPVSGIARFDFSGTATTSTITLTHMVTFTNGTTAKGTAVLNKP